MFFKVTKYITYNNNLKNNINIIHLSDIHYVNKRDIKLLNKIYDKLKKYKINYICITGDMIDSNETLDKDINKDILKNWLIKLSTLSPVLISLGNHDMYINLHNKPVYSFNKIFWDSINKLDNIYVLDNKDYMDNNIFIKGYTQSIDYYYKNKYEDKNIMMNELNKINIDKSPDNKLKLCLIHSPVRLNDKDIMLKLKNYVVLSGHMHNGLILPLFDELFKGNRGVISPNKRLFPNMARGYKNNVLISSGINKLHSKRIYILNIFNSLFPKNINVINIKNKKCKFSMTYKYER